MVFFPSFVSLYAWTRGGGGRFSLLNPCYFVDVPYNKKHEEGFISIGCEPCTKTVLPTQHERLGRWWWEDSTKKECGLHAKADKIG